MYFSTYTLHVLCYCVFDWHVLIHSDSMENLHGGKALRTTWHMTFPEEENGDLEANYSHYLKGSGVNEGHQLVVRAAKRVWEELYACKKPVRKGVFHSWQNFSVPLLRIITWNKHAKKITTVQTSHLFLFFSVSMYLFYPIICYCLVCHL